VRRLRAAAAILTAALLSGCGATDYYAGPSPALLPPHVHKIAVRPILKRVEAPGHNTVGWEDKLRLQIQSELIQDGRFNYVNEEADADGVLSAEITRIIFEPLAYDSNNVVREVKLLVIMNIAFQDLKMSRTLWEEKGLDQEFSYFVSTQPGGLTDDEARDELWDRFSRDVVKRIVEGFGSVTGVSDKKISNQAPPAPPAGAEPPTDEKKTRRAPPTSPY
jgi:hypothetical protein